MRSVLNTVSMEGRIVIGEGEKDEVRARCCHGVMWLQCAGSKLKCYAWL